MARKQFEWAKTGNSSALRVDEPGTFGKFFTSLGHKCNRAFHAIGLGEYKYDEAEFVRLYRAEASGLKDVHTSGGFENLCPLPAHPGLEGFNARGLNNMDLSEKKIRDRAEALREMGIFPSQCIEALRQIERHKLAFMDKHRAIADNAPDDQSRRAYLNGHDLG